MSTYFANTNYNILISSLITQTETVQLQHKSSCSDCAASDSNEKRVKMCSFMRYSATASTETCKKNKEPQLDHR